MSSGRAIRITLEQLRIAAKKPRRREPICHNETMKVLNALQAANWEIAPIYKYVKDYDDCIERAQEERKKGKASTLYHLSKYLVLSKNKKK
mmetsp:Transcript_9558/g.28695  ORF Transcript_9558/g.28695 Transcript_9558/m.28695 type:complete len:91 (+) Transcript_9558:160-432(+)